MTYRLIPCFYGCGKHHGVIYERKAARKAPDDLAGAGALRSRDIGRHPGPLRPSPVGTLPVSEGRKALSTTG